MTAADRNTAERITDDIRQHADVVRGHDAVHPDRSVCGGLGACALMRAEHEAEIEIVNTLVRVARRGLAVAVSVVKAGAR